MFEAAGLNYLAILDTAIDIAKGMSHLHDHHVIHSDLKVCEWSHFMQWSSNAL
jgi:serine/threonine protein kinase